MAAKAAGITSLDLSWNDLYALSAEQWKDFFMAAKDAGITSLDLRRNSFWRLTAKEKQAFSKVAEASGIIVLYEGSSLKNLCLSFLKSEPGASLKKQTTTTITNTNNTLFTAASYSYEAATVPSRSIPVDLGEKLDDLGVPFRKQPTLQGMTRDLLGIGQSRRLLPFNRHLSAYRLSIGTKSR